MPSFSTRACRMAVFGNLPPAVISSILQGFVAKNGVAIGRKAARLNASKKR